jgi:hypothetical protein
MALAAPHASLPAAATLLRIPLPPLRSLMRQARHLHRRRLTGCRLTWCARSGGAPSAPPRPRRPFRPMDPLASRQAEPARARARRRAEPWESPTLPASQASQQRWMMCRTGSESRRAHHGWSCQRLGRLIGAPQVPSIPPLRSLDMLFGHTRCHGPRRKRGAALKALRRLQNPSSTEERTSIRRGKLSRRSLPVPDSPFRPSDHAWPGVPRAGDPPSP